VNTDEEMRSGFAHVATVECPRSFDLTNLRIEALDGRANGSDFSYPRLCTWKSEDGNRRGQNGGIFHKR
jgi:hypothetical protein